MSAARVAAEPWPAWPKKERPDGGEGEEEEVLAFWARGVGGE